MLPAASPAAGAAAPSREMKQAAAGHGAVALQVLHRYSAATSARLSESMVSPDEYWVAWFLKAEKSESFSLKWETEDQAPN